MRRILTPLGEVVAAVTLALLLLSVSAAVVREVHRSKNGPCVEVPRWPEPMVRR